jgi:hypothetical protein
MPSSQDKILELLATKASAKQAIYRNTLTQFDQIKLLLRKMSEEWRDHLNGVAPHVEVAYNDKGHFECDLKFSGDTLSLVMHTNVFTFPPEHFVHNHQRIRKNPLLAYFGQIQVYNFLSDSLKYSRMADEGFLLARIFVDLENHFFVDGKQQFGFLFNDLEQQVLDQSALEKILTTAVHYCLDFDLMAPSFDQIKSVTLGQFLMQNGNSGLKTAKRLGFMGEN